MSSKDDTKRTDYETVEEYYQRIGKIIDDNKNLVAKVQALEAIIEGFQKNCKCCESKEDQ